MAKRRLYVWNTKRKPQRYEHNLIIRRFRAHAKRKEKWVPLPFERPPEDYTDSVCLLVRERGERHHAPVQALVDADQIDSLYQYDWVVQRRRKGERKGYILAHVQVDGERRTVWLHRLLKNPPQDKVVDHRNRNGFDNRDRNLRVCTKKENSRNTSPISNKTWTPYKGVKRAHSKKWDACIRVDGKTVLIAGFREPELAAYAYNILAREVFGEFAYENEVALKDEDKNLVRLVIEQTKVDRRRKEYYAKLPKVRKAKVVGMPQYGLSLLSMPE